MSPIKPQVHDSSSLPSFKDAAGIQTIVQLSNLCDFVLSSPNPVSVTEMAVYLAVHKNTIYLYISYLFDLNVPLRRLRGGTYTFWTRPSFYENLNEYIRGLTIRKI